MRKSFLATSAALVVLQMQALVRATVPIEQIEAYEHTPNDSGYDPYAPLNFSGNPTVTITDGDGGQYNGITFHADLASGDDQTVSGHAQTVGDFIYGSYGSPAYPYVTDVYDIAAAEFLNTVTGRQAATGVGPLPGSFAGGSLVINNSYVASDSSTDAYLDDNRRIDYMIDQADVVWVAAAVTGGAGFTQPQYLSWSNFNGLAVSGVQNSVQSFDPSGSPGKQHADLSFPLADGSFAAATVSGYAGGLLGVAQATDQADGQHGVIIRSILMAGADRISSSNTPTANNLDPIYGAGQPNYNSSLAIFNSGEVPLLSVTAGSNISGGTAVNQLGWDYQTISASQQYAVIFSSAGNISGLTASLNWNVTSQSSGSTLNTSTGALLFPNLTLELRPVTYDAGSGQYILGSSASDIQSSSFTGDNVQYLYDTSSLPTGTYAFLITGDSSLPASVGFSYDFSGSFASGWNSSTGSSWSTAANWTGSVPNGRGAQVTFGSSPGLAAPGTINLDNDRTVGQVFFTSSTNYTIASGTAGTLFIDDTGDISGTANPQINVSSGAQSISAPIYLENGLNLTVASGASLNVTGSLTGSGNLLKFGSGSVMFSNTLSADAFSFNGGTATLAATASFTSGPVYLNPGGTLNFAASTTSGIFIRSVAAGLTIRGGTLQVAPSSDSSNRQLLNLSSTLNFAGTTGDWQGQLDLGNNDLVDPGASLADVTDQILQGYNAGNWNGATGIISSSAAADSTHLTAIGVIQNNQSGSALYTADNPFDGITPGAGDILLKYTYYGDTNLDGIVDGTDYGRIDVGYLDQLTGWFNGDFNYDGVVDGSDYTLMDNAFNSQGAAISDQLASPLAVTTFQIAAPLSSVPEPSTTGLTAIAAAVLLSIRRRRLVTE